MRIRKRKWTAPNGEEKQAWLVDYRDQSGRRRSKQFTRKKDAEEYEGNSWQEVRQGTHTHDRDSITVSKAGELWLADRRADDLEPTTIAAYTQHLRLHIAPLCGDVKLSTLTTPIVQAYRDKLTARLSRPMAIRVLRSFKALIDEAMRLGYVSQNVATPVKIKRAKRLEQTITIPPKDALRRILEAAAASDNPAALPLHCLAIFGGLRASELRGMSWPYLHLKASTVEVAQRADAAGKIGPPKSNAGKRTIPLPDMAIKALREWKLACPASSDNLVFPSATGKPMNWKRLTDTIVTPVQIAAGEFDIVKTGDDISEVPRWGLHSFRHAAASLWIDQKVNPKRVQYLMGHSNIAVTLDTYAKLFDQVEKDAETASAIERALFSDAT
jgi:integrase